MSRTLINTTSCNSDYTVRLPIPYSLGTYITIQDNGSNPQFFASNSIVITTTPGYGFFDKNTYEYIRTPNGSLTFVAMSSQWRLVNTAAYTPSGHAFLSNVSTNYFFADGSITLSNVTVQNDLRSVSIDVQNAPTLAGMPIINRIDIQSTIEGLGSLGFLSSPSYITTSLVSTVQGLVDYGYITTTQNQSTVSGLGSLYVSTSGFTSTTSGLGKLYISTSGLVSSVTGLGTFGYISTQSLTSSVQGLGQIYISTPTLTSTVSNVVFLTTSNNQSTITNLGSLYISTPSLTSTIQGISTIYIVPSQFTSTTIALSSNFQPNIVSTLGGLGAVGYTSSLSLTSTVGSIFLINQSNISLQLSSIGNVYISSLSLQSTVAGLANIPLAYISVGHLTSTTTGLSASNISHLVSTVQNLGSLAYISTPHLTSTTVGISNIINVSIVSTIAGLGSLYISSASLQSTVAGLGTAGYISLSQITSTTSNIINIASNTTASTIVGLGTLRYISISQITSTVNEFSNINRSNFISTVNTLGSSYISSASLQSTVAGLGNLNYISLPHLISTTNALSVSASSSTIAGLGSFGYISTSMLRSTTTGTIANTPTISSNIASTVRSLGSLGYLSIASLHSTVRGLGTYYLSSGTLVSTAIGLQSNVTYSQLQNNTSLIKPDTLTTRIIASLGNPYEQRGDLLTTTNQILGSYTYYLDSLMVSTVYNATSGFTSVCVSVDGATVFATKTTSIINAGTGTTLTTLSQSIKGITCSSSYFYVTAGNQIIQVGISSPYTQTVIANTTNVAGFSNSSSPSTPSTASTVSFSNPTGIAFDSSQSFLYICDTGNDAIRRIQMNPFSVTTLASMSNPSGIAIASSNFAYIICSTGSLYRLSLITSNLTLLSTTYSSPTGICLDSSDSVAYITNTGANTVIQYTIATGSTLILGLGSATDGAAWLKSGSQPFATFTSPRGIFYGSDGFIYIADGFVRKLLPQKYTSTISGLLEYRNARTIPITSLSVTNTTSNQFVIASNLNSITTSPNIIFSNSSLYITSNLDATGYTVSAATFTASNGRSGGPNYGFYFGDATYVTSISDRRLKEEIRPITNALDKVNSLQAVNYRLHRDPSRNWIGYIAQDVEQILPEIVRTDDSPEGWKSIQYTNLPALIIEAIKELHAKYARIQYLCR